MTWTRTENLQTSPYNNESNTIQILCKIYFGPKANLQKYMCNSWVDEASLLMSPYLYIYYYYWNRHHVTVFKANCRSYWWVGLLSETSHPDDAKSQSEHYTDEIRRYGSLGWITEHKTLHHQNVQINRREKVRINPGARRRFFRCAALWRHGPWPPRTGDGCCRAAGCQ